MGRKTDNVHAQAKRLYNYLRENTRDKEKFGLVYAELIGYGFRRNLWGMKKLGVTLSIMIWNRALITNRAEVNSLPGCEIDYHSGL